MIIRHPVENNQSYTALALNYILPKFFAPLWNNARTRVCADGGANRVFDFGKTNKVDLKPPHCVVGDLDSLSPKVKDHYAKMKTSFVQIANQDFNDIEKSLSIITKNGITDPVLLFGAWGGRFDHTISALHSTLECKDLRIYILDDDNFATWIFPGDAGIYCPQKWTTKMCGLLPVAMPVEHIKTEGLKWDIDFGLKMGDFISSSNEIAEGRDFIKISTSQPIFWTNETKKYEDLPIPKDTMKD